MNLLDNLKKIEKDSDNENEEIYWTFVKSWYYFCYIIFKLSVKLYINTLSYTEKYVFIWNKYIHQIKKINL